MQTQNRRAGFLTALCAMGFVSAATANEFPCAPDCVENPRSTTPRSTPRDIEEPGASRSGPVLFSAPEPSGEVAGARRSIGLPAVRFSLPKMSIETPELRIIGCTKYRRNPFMEVEGATAPMTRESPAIYGQLMGAELGTRDVRPRDVRPRDVEPEPAPRNVEAPCVGGNSCTTQQAEEIRLLRLELQQLQAQIRQNAGRQAAEPPEFEEQPVRVPIEETNDAVTQRRSRSQSGTARLATWKSPAPEVDDAADDYRERRSVRQPSASRFEDLQRLEEHYQQQRREMKELEDHLATAEAEYQKTLEEQLRFLQAKQEARLREKIDSRTKNVRQASFDDFEGAN